VVEFGACGMVGSCVKATIFEIFVLELALKKGYF
jgi:hypothetical protein